MLRTIKSIVDLAGKKIVVIGAGNIAKGLLFEIEKEGITCSVSIFNRTLSHAESLKQRFPLVTDVNSLEKISEASGDVFVNLTDIGGKVKDYSFPEDLINKFLYVIDVTFETEQTPLIATAKKLNKKFATGWDMFTYQGQVCLDGLLGTTIDPVKFKKHVAAGLSQVVK